MTTRRRAPQRRGFTPRQRTKVSWENLFFAIAHPVAATLSLSDLTPEPMQTVHVGVGTATLRRMIGHATWAVEDPTLTEGIDDIAVGIGVVSQDGFAAGAVPDPLTDFNQDWLYWTIRTCNVPTTDGGGLLQVDWDWDIRSMRRLRGGYALAMMTESGGDNNIHTLNITLRMLWSQEP